LNIKARYGDFSALYMENGYYSKSKVGYGGVQALEQDYDFKQTRAELAYKPSITDELIGEFKVNWSRNRPLCSTNGTASLALEIDNKFPLVGCNRDTQRAASGLLSYKITDAINIYGGAEVVREELNIHNPAVDINYTDVPHRTDQVAYAQIQGSFDIANVALGNRYERSSNFESVNVSRLSITRAESGWHAKLEGAQAYRNPYLYQSWTAYDPEDPGYELAPVSYEVIQGEIGHSVGEWAYATLSGFRTKGEDVISYFYDETNPKTLETGDTYRNSGEMEVIGAGAELKVNYGQADLKLGYSYVRRGSGSSSNSPGSFTKTEENYDTDDYYIGLSPHSLVFTGLYRISEGTTFFTSYNMVGPQWTAKGYREDFSPDPLWIGPIHTWNANVRFSNVYVENLSVQIGVANILDDRQRPYGYNDNPERRLGREGFVNAAYEW